MVTDDIEVCGSNCTPGRTAESKVHNRPFLCPDAGCKAKIKTLLPNRKRDKAGQFLRAAVGRPCVLSHVYGLDRDKDAARVEEKAAEAGKRRGPKAVRKRSASPNGRKGEKLGSRKERPVEIADDEAAELAELVQNPDVLQLMRAMGTAHTRRLRGDRLETKAEILVEGMTTRATTKLENLEMNGKPSRAPVPLAFKEQRATAKENHPADTIEDGDYAEQVDDADLYCICRSTNPACLIMCERCDNGFHPGCIGEGKWAIQEYEEDSPNREFNFKTDFDKIIRYGHASIFHCPDCKVAVAAALEKFKSGVTQPAAAEPAGEDLEDDAIQAILDDRMQNLAHPPRKSLMVILRYKKKSTSTDDKDIVMSNTASQGMANSPRRGTKRKADFANAEMEAEADGEDVKMTDVDGAQDTAPSSQRAAKRRAVLSNGKMVAGMDTQETKMADAAFRERQVALRKSSRPRQPSRKYEE